MADNNASLPVQLVNDLVASIQTTLAEADRRIRSIENRQIGRTGLARMFEGIDGIPLRPMPLMQRPMPLVQCHPKSMPRKRRRRK
jgi:hypothetical protein